MTNGAWNAWATLVFRVRPNDIAGREADADLPFAWDTTSTTMMTCPLPPPSCVISTRASLQATPPPPLRCQQMTRSSQHLATEAFVAAGGQTIAATLLYANTSHPGAQLPLSHLSCFFAHGC
ncbi:unnamed protein product [Cercospora beticola]|nr:unnamed protein product [Cercospora beticola]